MDLERNAWNVAQEEYQPIKAARGMIDLSRHHVIRLERMYALAMGDMSEAADRYARVVPTLSNNFDGNEIKKSLGIEVDAAMGVADRLARELESRFPRDSWQRQDWPQYIRSIRHLRRKPDPSKNI